MDNAVFLTEAGPGVGFGHLVRMSALRSFFIKKGIKTLLLLKLAGNEYNQQDYGSDIEIANWLTDRKRLNDLSSFFPVVIIDSYLAAEEYYAFLKTVFKKVVAFDDYNRIKYSVDMIVNSNIYGDLMHYGNQRSKVIGGRNYVIIREAILEHKDVFKLKSDVYRILITIGGSDYRKLLPRIIDAIKKLHYEILVVAANDSYKHHLEKTFKAKNLTTYGCLSAKEMASLLLNADIAISSAGQTLNELAFLGIPTIAILMDKDQVYNMEAYYKSGFLLEKLKWDDVGLISRILELLKKMKSNDLRSYLSNKSRDLFNGRGLENLFHVIYATARH